MDEYEAELIGLHLGDGTLYLVNKKYPVWELRGGLEEKYFYDNHLKNLLMNIFNQEYKPKYRSTSKGRFCYGFQICKKEVTSYFLNKGFVPGTKTYTCKIPDYIKTDESLMIACLRGLFDSDGCIWFDKINNNKVHTYPKIEFGIASEKLRNDIYCILRQLGFRTIKWNDRKYFKVGINGKKQANRFFSEIQPKNVKHLNRYQFWKDNGYFIPKTMKSPQ